MKFATESRNAQVLVWLIWLIALLVFLRMPERVSTEPTVGPPLLAGVVTHHRSDGALFPWESRRLLRYWVWRRLARLRQAQRRALWVKHLAYLALRGALTMAALVDLLTQAQLRRHMGALPVLYGLLETLHVRQIINRYCPSAAEVDHGTVALVMVLNRLLAPRPLSWIADWVARTVLVHLLGIPAAKFNDDRLGRTLEAIRQHSREIWQDIVHQALIQADIDLSVIFYDLTAFVAHGSYSGSQVVDFGFAHNTPMNKRKVKAGLDVAADGNIPTEYASWPGRTADLATVQENMARLRRLLKQHGWPVGEVIVIGDRANLNDELAFAYDDHGLHYLAGLKAQGKAHRELLLAQPEKQLRQHPLGHERGRDGHWGMPCRVAFEHDGRKATHKGLVLLSGPMRSALRRERATQLRQLYQALGQIQAKVGRPWYRTADAVQKRADTVIRQSPVGKFVRAQADTDTQGGIHLRWWIDRYILWQTMQKDGRYLLVTNDWSLSPQRMFDLYRQKDGAEKRFTVLKSDLKVSPIYLHKDERIEGMLLINMLALLTYSLLERQVRRNGLQITTRRLIEKLESLDIVETTCRDGSLLYRITPVDEEQAAILEILAHVLADLQHPRRCNVLLPSGNLLFLPLPIPLALPPPKS
jgi:transposase